MRRLNRERPAEVEVVTVTERDGRDQASVLNASGYVTARRRATISSKVTGKLIEVNVEEGMAVRQGEVLARLDDASARAGLALANAQLEAARGAMRETEVRVAEAQLTLSAAYSWPRTSSGRKPMWIRPKPRWIRSPLESSPRKASR